MSTPAAEIIDYVAIDPVTAERVLMAISADEKIAGIDRRTAQIIHSGDWCPSHRRIVSPPL